MTVKMERKLEGEETRHMITPLPDYLGVNDAFLFSLA
jgi:hypothetical protein